MYLVRKFDNIIIIVIVIVIAIVIIITTTTTATSIFTSIENFINTSLKSP